MLTYVPIEGVRCSVAVKIIKHPSATSAAFITTKNQVGALLSIYKAARITIQLQYIVKLIKC